MGTGENAGNLLFQGQLTLHQVIPTFNDPEKESFCKHFVKSRKCRKQAFSPFPTLGQCTYPCLPGFFFTSTSQNISLNPFTTLPPNHHLTLSQTIPTFNNPQKETF